MLRRSILITNLFLSITTVGHASTFQQDTDITDQLNQAIKNGGNINIPAGSYKIDATKGINIPNNTTINMDKDTILTVIPNSLKVYKVFIISNSKNIKINGGTIIGDKYTHLGTDGEWGMGVLINDSQNISLSNMNINKMWGDAIYIGTNGQDSNYNITLNNIKMDDNRRQGISVISVNKLRGSNLSISNTNGVAPGAGIDIEPNNNKALLKDIRFKNVYTKNNFNAGFCAYLNKYKGSSNPVDITLINHTDIGSLYGFCSLETKEINGFIKNDSANYSKSQNSNLCIANNNVNFRINITNYKSKLDSKTSSDCPKITNNKTISFN